MSTEETWIKYKEEPTEELKLELFHFYLKWAEGVGKKFIFNHVCISYEDDIMQFARLGLLDAIERYVITEGATFKTYAGKRVYYNIIDCLRKDGTYKRGSINSDEKYSPIPVSLESMTMTNEDVDDFSNPVDFPDDRESEDFTRTRNEEFMEDIATSGLGVREIEIVRLMFVEGYNFEQTARLIEMSESRVSQLVSTIIKPLLREHYIKKKILVTDFQRTSIFLISF